MSPDQKLTDARNLLARAEAELRAEFGGVYRPVKDALDAAYKASVDLAQLRDLTSAKTNKEAPNA